MKQLNEQVWLERFTSHLHNLKQTVEPDFVQARATLMWPSMGHLIPEEVAEVEFITEHITAA